MEYQALIFKINVSPHPTSACQRNVITRFIPVRRLLSDCLCSVYILVVTLSPTPDAKDYSVTTHPPSRVLTPNLSKIKWRRSGSNRRPVACKATALPTELHPRIDALGFEPSFSCFRGKRVSTTPSV